MSYCKEFIDLFKDENDDPIFDPQKLSAAGIKYEDFEFAVTRNKTVPAIINCQALEPILSNCLNSFVGDLRNPIPGFHIGLGNPDANILIVGNELAINLLTPNPKQLRDLGGCTNYQYYKLLFINEVFLNYFSWKLKVNRGGGLFHPNCCVQDPQFPPSFCWLFNKEKSSGHNWEYINRIINSQNANFDFSSQQLQNSFFSEVFLTEINSLPAARG